MRVYEPLGVGPNNQIRTLIASSLHNCCLQAPKGVGSDLVAFVACTGDDVVAARRQDLAKPCVTFVFQVPCVNSR